MTDTEDTNMGKRIIAVNAGPRMGWNTETLISEASKGAESMGAEVERFGEMCKMKIFA